ncbi:hypothetical protein ABNG03_01290 [Halorubrum sp. RMP-47]|uniref:Uncharacterized protein n=1 Tax=Halorubrum miltondacostae TaxID=3076378 RepID=A0ABD5M404_9EURY
MTEPDSTSAESRSGLTMDGRVATRKTPETAATEHPAVLDVDVTGDRALAIVEKGDVSVVVEAPAGISAEELEETLDGAPESIAKTTGRFAGTGDGENAVGGDTA